MRLRRNGQLVSSESLQENHDREESHKTGEESVQERQLNQIYQVR